SPGGNPAMPQMSEEMESRASEQAGMSPPAAASALTPQTGAGEHAGMAMPASPSPSDKAAAMEEMPAGSVQLSLRKQQTSGIRTGRVEERLLARTIRTVGLLQADETRIRHMHTKISGWIERLYVNFTGQLVDRGQPVIALY